MIGVYDITLAEQKIGTADVNREGLYYRFRCKCCLSGNVIYKLVAASGDRKVDLGICVPMDYGFGLETKVPVKRLGEGELTFLAMPKHDSLKGKFIPIRADEPFSYIDKLQNAYLEIRNGQTGIALQEKK